MGCCSCCGPCSTCWTPCPDPQAEPLSAALALRAGSRRRPVRRRRRHSRPDLPGGRTPSAGAAHRRCAPARPTVGRGAGVRRPPVAGRSGAAAGHASGPASPARLTEVGLPEITVGALDPPTAAGADRRSRRDRPAGGIPRSAVPGDRRQSARAAGTVDGHLRGVAAAAPGRAGAGPAGRRPGGGAGDRAGWIRPPAPPWSSPPRPAASSPTWCVRWRCSESTRRRCNGWSGRTC